MTNEEWEREINRRVEQLSIKRGIPMAQVALGKFPGSLWSLTGPNCYSVGPPQGLGVCPNCWYFQVGTIRGSHRHTRCQTFRG